MPAPWRRTDRSAFGKRDGVLYRAGYRVWTANEDAKMRAWYPDLRSDVIAGLLQRNLSAIYARATTLGLTKSAAFRASLDACRLRRDSAAVGIPFRFQKGQVPANKGLRRPGWHRGRMRETQFKKGQRSGTAATHWMPIGATRLIKGYVYRKVSDVPNVPYTVNWKPEHHLVWAAAHGPVPPGHALQFVNGNQRDVRLDNLRLLTRRELLAQNSVQNLPPELRSTIQLIGQLTRRIRERERHAEAHD